MHCDWKLIIIQSKILLESAVAGSFLIDPLG